MKAPSEDELYDQMVRTETMGHAARGAAAGTLAGAAARAVGSHLGPVSGAVVGAAVGGLHGRNKGKANVLADKVKKEREQMKADARESKKHAGLKEDIARGRRIRSGQQILYEQMSPEERQEVMEYAPIAGTALGGGAGLLAGTMASLPLSFIPRYGEVASAAAPILGTVGGMVGGYLHGRSAQQRAGSANPGKIPFMFRPEVHNHLGWRAAEAAYNQAHPEEMKQASDLTLLSGMHHIKESMDAEKLAFLGQAASTIGKAVTRGAGRLLGNEKYLDLARRSASVGGMANVQRGVGYGVMGAGALGAGALGTGYMAGRASR